MEDVVLQILATIEYNFISLKKRKEDKKWTRLF